MKLSFDPMTIEHLGFKMYSHLPNAVAELIANAYDADAGHATVVVRNEPRSVEVRDDGHGMSADDLADKYLRIGRNRRTEDSGISESGRRRVAGKKGLGKLALFGIGNRITVRTKRAGALAWTVVTLDWEELKKSTGGEYRPETEVVPGNPRDHGTTILVRQMSRKTPVVGSALASSLARLFNYVGDDFAVEVSQPDKSDQPFAVTRDLRYAAIEVETMWAVPLDVLGAGEQPPDTSIGGVIYASVRPLPPEMRGVTLYVRGRLANEPEYYGVPESSYAYSYITGFVDADYLDDLPVDVISTDRRSVSWEHDAAQALRGYLAAILRHVALLRRDTRRAANKKRLREDLGVNPEEWAGTIRGPEASSVKMVLELASSPDSEMSNEDRRSLVQGMREIAPEHADMHWRHLHPRIQEACESLYRDRHYFQSVEAAIKRYVTDVRAASGEFTMQDYNLLETAFRENGKVDVFVPFETMGLHPDTAKNMRSCQEKLSVGVLQGFRNLLAHVEVTVLRTSGIFTFQDCLDALGIVSHLRRRLDGATAAAPGATA